MAEDNLNATANDEEAIEEAAYELSKHKVDDKEENHNSSNDDHEEENDNNEYDADLAEIEEDLHMIDSDIEK